MKISLYIFSYSKGARRFFSTGKPVYLNLEGKSKATQSWVSSIHTEVFFSSPRFFPCILLITCSKNQTILKGWPIINRGPKSYNTLWVTLLAVQRFVPKSELSSFQNCFIKQKISSHSSHYEKAMTGEKTSLYMDGVISSLRAALDFFPDFNYEGLPVKKPPKCKKI